MSDKLHSNSANLFDSLAFPPGNLTTSKTSSAPSMLINQRPLAMFEAEQSTSQDEFTPSTKTKSSALAGIIEGSGCQRPASFSSPDSRRDFFYR